MASKEFEGHGGAGRQQADDAVRRQYRVLGDAEQAQMAAIKDKGAELLVLIDSIGSSRELSIAKTKTEEAVMWTVKHVTR
jgi:hypothetical protein